MRVAVAAAMIAGVSAACGGGGPDRLLTGEDPMLTCVGPPFTAAALDRPADAEKRPGPEGDALRSAIAGPPFAPTRISGWRELGRSADEVAFAAGEPPVFQGYVQLRRDGDAWRYSGSGSNCVVRPDHPGRGLARWGLDPDVEPPTGGSTVLQVIVSEPCAAELDDRLEEPTIVSTAEAVTITFFPRPARGAGNTAGCRLHPPAHRRVDLPARLGNRKLLDGALYPPQPPCRVELSTGDCANDITEVLGR